MPAATCRGGSGVIVLPCGAGKTIVGLAAMGALKAETLILTTSTTAVEQWKREILDKTDLDPALVGTYTGDSKTLAPVTLATYQIVTYRPKKDGDFPHFHLFDQRDWGLIIYDEVHLLPAPVFRITADIQARRRLGLTATLVREDNREEDVFSLIGPKKYDVPWRVLESKGWIAEARCHEVRLGLPAALRMEYALAEWREKFRLASENPIKDELVAVLLERFDGPDDRVLIIGQYLKQLRRIAERFDIPLITGQTPNGEREDLYGKFRRGVLRKLILSKVGNFAIDLPDANVMVQVSGTFGSRQEEAQRLGRILRPKEGEIPARFYTLVSRDTREMDFAHHRQLFLTEQGYNYEILDESDLAMGDCRALGGDRLGPLPPFSPRAVRSLASFKNFAPAIGCATMISNARIGVKLHKNVTLIRTTDPVLAEELLARKTLARWVVGRLSDTVLLVQPDEADVVIEELRRMGHTPRVVHRGTSRDVCRIAVAVEPEPGRRSGGPAARAHRAGGGGAAAGVSHRTLPLQGASTGSNPAGAGGCAGRRAYSAIRQRRRDHRTPRPASGRRCAGCEARHRLANGPQPF